MVVEPVVGSGSECQCTQSWHRPPWWKRGPRGPEMAHGSQVVDGTQVDGTE